MSRALSLAAAVSLGALPPALVTALVLAPVLVNCSVRAMLPWMFAVSLVPALVSAAFVQWMRAHTPAGRIVTGSFAFGVPGLLLIGVVLLNMKFGVLAMVVMIPLAILASMFGVLGVPVFALTLRYSSSRRCPALLVAGAVVPVAVVAFHETGRTCHLIL